MTDRAAHGPRWRGRASAPPPTPTSGAGRRTRRRRSTSWSPSSGIGPGRDVLDLAAGTGKLTRSSLATGATVVAVEPLEAMRALAGRTVEALDGHGRGDPAAGCAPSTPSPSARPSTGSTPARPAPRSPVCSGPAAASALVWNERDPSVPWVAELDAHHRLAGAAAVPERHRLGGRRSTRTGHFGPVGHRRLTWEQELDEDTLVDRVLSTSYVATWSTADRQAAVAAPGRGPWSPASPPTIRLPARHRRLLVQRRPPEVGRRSAAATCPGAAPATRGRCWSSELMLQQTQVPRVVPRWAAFLERVPRRRPRARRRRRATWSGRGPASATTAGRSTSTGARPPWSSATAARLPDDLDALLALPGHRPVHRPGRAGLRLRARHRRWSTPTPAASSPAPAPAGRWRRGRRRRWPTRWCRRATGWAWGQAVFDLGALVCTKRGAGVRRAARSSRSCAWAAAGWPRPRPGRRLGRHQRAAVDVRGLRPPGPRPPGRRPPPRAGPAGARRRPHRLAGRRRAAERVADTLVADGLAVRRPDGAYAPALGLRPGSWPAPGA